MKTQEKSQPPKEYFLFIDTAEKEASVALLGSELSEIDRIKISNSQVLSNELLKKIEILLSQNNIEKKDLIGIYVNSGPGAYTGLRVGLTTANVLAFALNIPIMNLKEDNKNNKSKLITTSFSKSVIPVYANPPFITKPKSTRLR